jgi:hypothetical protein
MRSIPGQKSFKGTGEGFVQALRIKEFSLLIPKNPGIFF